MKKRYGFILIALLFPLFAQAQIVIRDYGGGVTVSGNDSCPGGSAGGGDYGGPAYIYGAIVHVKGTSRFFVEARQASPGEASNRALSACQRASGKTCQVDMYFKGFQCYAAAVGGSYYATAKAYSESEAKQRALRNCQTDRQRCRVVASDCPR